VNELNDKSRRVARIGNRVFVPLKFDDEGNPLTNETFDPSKHLKALSLNDLAFLKAWRASGWDDKKACEVTHIEPESAKRLIRRLKPFKDEEARVKALADIPTPTWISAKHVENVSEGSLDDSQRDSLKELAKITGAYKPLQQTVTHNVFTMSLPENLESEFKALADKALESEIVHE